MSIDDHAEFGRRIDRREIVICVGSGGVGKTTTSAVIGLQAALGGEKVLVLTIDPARRLANSLGIDEIGSKRQQISLDQFDVDDSESTGELWAMMLDMKEAFDRLVQREAPDEETRQEILENRFYQYFSTSLAGTQEYAASERLYELYEEDEFDLVVLDTPPTTHALDFLEAPERLAKALSSRALQWIYQPGVLSGSPARGILSVGTSYVMRTLSKFTGGELLDELQVFLKTFSALFEGFERRARAVHELIGSGSTGFVVVTAPDTLTVEDALFFFETLGGDSLNIDAFVVNRVHPQWVSEEQFQRAEGRLSGVIDTARRQLSEASDTKIQAVDVDDLADRMMENVAQFQLRARQDAGSIEKMGRELPPGLPIAKVPYFNEDIHSLTGLEKARRELFGERIGQ